MAEEVVKTETLVKDKWQKKVNKPGLIGRFIQ